MAFTSAAGYGNLPSGNFVPEVFSKKAQLRFRKEAVVPAITNSDYFGEIQAYGDTVYIIKEPDITISDYQRGKTLTSQDLADDQLTLTIDQAKYYQFRMDDLEKRQTHINWMDLAANRAAYKLKDSYDTAILSHIATQVTTEVNALTNDTDADQLIGTTSSAQKVGYGGTQMTPLNLMARAARILDENDVPTDGRYAVLDPVFIELLSDENSKLLNDDYVQDSSKRLLNGRVAKGEIRGFAPYKSRNLPVGGTGPTATSGGTNYGTLIFGHASAVATAEQMLKDAEKFRDPNSFGDIVRGLHYYGRKVLRPNAVVIVRYNQAT